MPLEDEAMSPPVLSEQNEEAGAPLSPVPEIPPWTAEVNPAPREGGALGRGPWDSPNRAAFLKNKLRALLAAPRSLRRSSCFGGRIDRIGAQSGLGCNSFRVRGPGDGDGVRRKEGVVPPSLTSVLEDHYGDAFRRERDQQRCPSLRSVCPNLAHESRARAASLVRKESSRLEHRLLNVFVGPSQRHPARVGRRCSSPELPDPKGPLNVARMDLRSV